MILVHELNELQLMLKDIIPDAIGKIYMRYLQMILEVRSTFAKNMVHGFYCSVQDKDILGQNLIAIQKDYITRLGEIIKVIIKFKVLN